MANDEPHSPAINCIGVNKAGLHHLNLELPCPA